MHDCCDWALVVQCWDIDGMRPASKKERKQAFVYRTNILKKIPWKACIFSKEKESREP